MYTQDVILELSKRVSVIAEKKGYGNSYAYQYGYFQSEISELLENILTPEQKAQLMDEVKNKK